MDLRETGTCGGGKILIKNTWKVSVFIGIYGGGTEVRQCLWAPHALVARPRAWARHQTVWAHGGSSGPPEASRVPRAPEKIIKNWHGDLTFVDILFL